MKEKIIYTIIILLCAQTIYLVINNRQLKRENGRLKFMLYTPAEGIPQKQKSSVLPTLSLTNVKTGELTSLGEPAKTDGTILFVFSTGCFMCDAAVESWNEVYRDFKDRYAVMGISKDGAAAVEEFMTRNNTNFPVFHYKNSIDIELFDKLPQTLIMDKNGQIVQTFKGSGAALRDEIVGFIYGSVDRGNK